MSLLKVAQVGTSGTSVTTERQLSYSKRQLSYSRRHYIYELLTNIPKVAQQTPMSRVYIYLQHKPPYIIYIYTYFINIQPIEQYEIKRAPRYFLTQVPPTVQSGILSIYIIYIYTLYVGGNLKLFIMSILLPPLSCSLTHTLILSQQQPSHNFSLPNGHSRYFALCAKVLYSILPECYA